MNYHYKIYIYCILHCDNEFPSESFNLNIATDFEISEFRNMKTYEIHFTLQFSSILCHYT
jgi:phosphorylcholine metabolism protein LicD